MHGAGHGAGLLPRKPNTSSRVEVGLLDRDAEGLTGPPQRAAEEFGAARPSLDDGSDDLAARARGHAERVAAYGLALAEVYGMRLADEPQIEFGFLLHDVGKVAVPDAILFKPGPMTEVERSVMQQHPVTGTEIVRDIEFLGAAREVIRSHHERWDGAGYPDGLAGEQIPIISRIALVCDAYHAMTSDRPYRAAMAPDAARREIAANAGSQFCPASAQALLTTLEAE